MDETNTSTPIKQGSSTENNVSTTRDRELEDLRELVSIADQAMGCVTSNCMRDRLNKYREARQRIDISRQLQEERKNNGEV